MGGALRRRAARVVCFDPTARILLMRWRDPASGRAILEPPGGGVENGEEPLEAARRELVEEVGRVLELREDWALDWERDCRWAGQRILASERFYGAVVAEAFEAEPAAFTPSETATYLGAYWVPRAGLVAPASLPGDLEPPELASIVARLAAMRDDARRHGPGA
jgi:8-oxo-dGTP pyrophosphatase MutT (NUDIX family)